MQIGSIDLGSRPVFLAPMEDVSDPPFRVLCKRLGADLLYSEFISSGGLVYEAHDSLRKLEFLPEERPVAIQIFGGDLEMVRAATRIVDEAAPDIIDINFGCPVKKVVRQDAGAGVLRNLDLMRQITESVVETATRPVTVKTRLGWNEDTIQIHQVARMLQEAGIQALTVHARTRAQMYKGHADWTWLRRLKADESIQVPLIGNGDATTPELIRQMFEETGVDAVMVGRGAIGNPWIFRDAKALLTTGEIPPPPTWEERIAVVAEHLRLKCDWLGERKGVLEMRKMYSGYFRGLAGGARCRARLMEPTTCDAVLERLLNLSERELEHVD